MKRKYLQVIAVIASVILFTTCQKDDTIIENSIIINVSPPEGGNVPPGSGTYENKAIVTLKATPSPEYLFKNWSGGASGTNNPTTVIMNSDKNVPLSLRRKHINYL